jgi:hypothetical protein
VIITLTPGDDNARVSNLIHIIIRFYHNLCKYNYLQLCIQKTTVTTPVRIVVVNAAVVGFAPGAAAHPTTTFSIPFISGTIAVKWLSLQSTHFIFFVLHKDEQAPERNDIGH